MRRRPFLLVALALLVPLPAFALGGETAPGGGLPRAGQLGVSASLQGCGVLDNSVVCQIDADFSPVDGATSYAASVTRADGSVIDYGDVSAGGASFWVPYAGDGTYSVTVSAYGQLDSDPQPDLVAKGHSYAGRSSHHTVGGQAASRRSPAQGPGAYAPSNGSAGQAGDGQPNGGDGSGPTDTPECPDPTTPPDPSTGADGTTSPDGTAIDGAQPQPPADCPPTPPPPDPGTGDGTTDPGTTTTPDPGTTTTPSNAPPPAG